MDTDGRMAMRCIMAPEQAEHLALKEYATIKLMQVIAERDAAVVERDNVLADKKAAFNERDSAFLQRDIAFAERDAAMLERDNAMTALENARGHRALGWNQFKRQPDMKGRDATMLQMSLPNGPFMVDEAHPFNADPSMLGFINNNSEKTQAMQQQQLGNSKSRKKDGTEPKRERKPPATASADGSKAEGKKKRADTSSRTQEGGVPLILPVVPYLGQESEQQQQKNEMHQFVEEQAYVIHTPIPYCSCTGTTQPCYRWGNGGWQSACCTNTLSVHPLPMNPMKRGYRLPGRKMSAGAFQKLVKRLTQEGVDLNQPIDLKNYWAKHGTNRYITIK